MKSINEYRKSVGLSELQVTYKLIAAAIANANYSDVKFGHSMQFDTSENLAWNYGTDPKPQWVDQEKAFFDQAVQELYGVTGLIGKDAVDFYKSHSGIESYVNQHFKVAGYPATVGHYCMSSALKSAIWAWRSAARDHERAGRPTASIPQTWVGQAPVGT